MKVLSYIASSGFHNPHMQVTLGIQRYTDSPATADVVCRFGEYDLHDLVELDHQTVGVMIQADAETCQILTNRNAVSLFSFAAGV